MPQSPSYSVLLVSLLQDTLAVGSELQGLKVKQLHVGGLPPSSKEALPQGLVGCIQVGVGMGMWHKGIRVSSQSSGDPGGSQKQRLSGVGHELPGAGEGKWMTQSCWRQSRPSCGLRGQSLA